MTFVHNLRSTLSKRKFHRRLSFYALREGPIRCFYHRPQQYSEATVTYVHKDNPHLHILTTEISWAKVEGLTERIRIPFERTGGGCK